MNHLVNQSLRSPKKPSEGRSPVKIKLIFALGGRVIKSIRVRPLIFPSLLFLTPFSRPEL